MKPGQQALMPPKRERGAALLAADSLLRQVRARGVIPDPVLSIALRDAARAADRARATDSEGGRLAYVSRELRAARVDVVALLPADDRSDPFTRLLAEFEMVDTARSGPAH